MIMNASEAEELDADLYCATCKQRYGELVPVRGNPSAEGFFVCPRSATMSHYGPNSFAIDEHGIRYEYGESDEIVVRTPSDPVSSFIQRCRMIVFGTVL